MGQKLNREDDGKDDLRIRNFRQGEELVLKDIYFASMRGLEEDHGLSLLLDQSGPKEHDEDAWRKNLREKRPFVAELDGKIAGFAVMGKPGLIEAFYVSPDFSGKGVGGTLMTHLETMARRQELSELSIYVNMPMAPFFEKNGFYTAKRHNSFCRGVHVPSAHMRKRLS